MYTVTLVNRQDSYVQKHFTTQHDRLADAALTKLAWEKNLPYLKGSVVVFDEYDYLVPASELNKGLAIKYNELQSQLRYFEGVDLAEEVPQLALFQVR